MLIDSYVKSLSSVFVTMAPASITSSKPKVELYSHADEYVVGDNYLVVHDNNRPVDVYTYDQKDDHRSDKTVGSVVGYQDSWSG